MFIIPKMECLDGNNPFKREGCIVFTSKRFLSNLGYRPTLRNLKENFNIFMKIRK